MARLPSRHGSSAFKIMCEIEPATRPDLMRVRHQIGVMSRVASGFLIHDNHIGLATVSSIAVAHEVGLMGGCAMSRCSSVKSCVPLPVNETVQYRDRVPRRVAVPVKFDRVGDRRRQLLTHRGDERPHQLRLRSPATQPTIELAVVDQRRGSQATGHQHHITRRRTRVLDVHNRTWALTASRNPVGRARVRDAATLPPVPIRELDARPA